MTGRQAAPTVARVARLVMLFLLLLGTAGLHTLGRHDPSHHRSFGVAVDRVLCHPEAAAGAPAGVRADIGQAPAAGADDGGDPPTPCLDPGTACEAVPVSRSSGIDGTGVVASPASRAVIGARVDRPEDASDGFRHRAGSR